MKNRKMGTTRGDGRQAPRMSAMAVALAATAAMMVIFFGTQSAHADAITVTPNPAMKTWSEACACGSTITFTVTNTTTANVELFAIVQTITSSGDDMRDEADFHPNDTSNCRMNNSILAAGKSCTIRAFYDVLDKDPNDQHTVDDSGVFNVTTDVAFGPVGGPVTGHASGIATVTVTDCPVAPGKGPNTCAPPPVPEPSAWSLVGAGLIALLGRRRACSSLT